LRERIVNRTVNPLLAGLPTRFERFRGEQVRGIGEIVKAFDETDIVVLDAPTGSGKTLIAETVRRMLRARMLFVTPSKSLQDQFVREFEYARAVKGRANYSTHLFPRSFPDVSCDDCAWRPESPSCPLCDSKPQCPYETAKRAAVASDVAVVNSAYALTEWNGPGRFSGRELVVLDEADTFEAAVVGHISVEISQRRMQRLGWKPPAKVTVRECWKEWLDEHIPLAARLAGKETDERYRRSFERLQGSLTKVRTGLDSDIPYAFTGREGSVGFKPAYVGDYCKDAVWAHGTRWLLMSATVVSTGSLLDGLGRSGQCATEPVSVSLRSTFDASHRPVVISPVTNMSKNGREDNVDKLAGAIRDLLAVERGRVVVHSVSYSLTRDICDRLDTGERRVVSYGLAGERTLAVSEYVRTPGCVLVAPSADRGIDLPDDLCRLCIIAKVPYPNLGDRMVSMRLHMPDGQTWYNVQTVRSIVQAAGRGVRHEEDYCKTVILDSQFVYGVWWKSRHLFPAWFKEAMIWTQ
jgi:Rad3-related DNA helicase